MKQLACKDIPDRPILEYLYERKNKGLSDCVWYNDCENSIRPAMPPGIPDKLAIAKMARLIKRGLVDGCPCGCRGNYSILQRGIEYLQYLNL